MTERGKAVWFPKSTLLKLDALRVGDESIPSVVDRMLKELKILKESQKK